MIRIARNLSSSTSIQILKPLVPLSTTSIPFALSLLSISHSQHSHFLLSYPAPFSLSFFSSKPGFSPQQQQQQQSSLLSITRDGNYSDATPPAAVCPGCGIHIQDSDPKQPGFFAKPSVKDPNYKSRSSLVHVSLEFEFSTSLKRGVVIDDANARIHDSDEIPVTVTEKPIVCARCHSLRHYGKVKDPTVENLLPEFDFKSTVGRRLVSASGARSVVLLVVDAVDFDGSFPKQVASLVSEAIEQNYNSWKEGKSGNVPRLLLVVTKIDLLPTSLSPTGFEHWVRQRAREGGASIVKKVHFVSAVKDWGMKDLVDDVINMAGARGNVWAVGMQNAGKSTLINAMAKWAAGGGGVEQGKKLTHLTEAPVPGTTLGIVRVEGVLPGQAKLFDTPGLLNPHQITTRLTRDEQKLVHVSKELKARTYRIKEGYSVHIGGLIRLDIEELSVDSMYVTVWASPYLPLHMGKSENASTMVADHFGRQLQPPIGEERVKELGKWVRRGFSISGSSWDSSSVDIAAAGVGWYAIALKGEAVLGVWTYEGVDVVLRNPLIPFRAQVFEVAGFTVSKIVSKADKSLNKSKHKTEGNGRQVPEDESLLSMVDRAAANSC